MKNKQELLDLMAVSITMLATRSLVPAPGQDWPTWLTDIAQSQRQSLLAHRDGARLVAGTRPFEAIFDGIEVMMKSLVGVGFTPGQAIRGLTTLSMFVGGFVLEEQAEQGRWQQGGVQESDDAAFDRLAATGRWPLVVQAFTEGGDPNGEEAFVDGVAMIVVGLRAVLDSNAAAPTRAWPSRTAVPR